MIEPSRFDDHTESCSATSDDTAHAHTSSMHVHTCDDHTRTSDFVVVGATAGLCSCIRRRGSRVLLRHERGELVARLGIEHGDLPVVAADPHRAIVRLRQAHDSVAHLEHTIANALRMHMSMRVHA